MYGEWALHKLQLSTQKEAVLKAISMVIAAKKTVLRPNRFFSITEHASTKAFNDFCIQLYSTIQGSFSVLEKYITNLLVSKHLQSFIVVSFTQSFISSVLLALALKNCIIS